MAAAVAMALDAAMDLNRCRGGHGGAEFAGSSDDQKPRWRPATQHRVHAQWFILRYQEGYRPTPVYSRSFLKISADPLGISELNFGNKL